MVGDEAVKHAFLVMFSPQRHYYGHVGCGPNPNDPRYVERHRLERDDPDDPDALIHTFDVGSLIFEVGFGGIPGAHKFDTLDGAVAVASSDYVKRQYGDYGYRISVIVVRLHAGTSGVFPELGDVGAEVWPTGDLKLALANLEKAGPAKRNAAFLAVVRLDHETGECRVIEVTAESFDDAIQKIADERWTRDFIATSLRGMTVELFEVYSRDAGAAFRRFVDGMR